MPEPLPAEPITESVVPPVPPPVPGVAAPPLPVEPLAIGEVVARSFALWGRHLVPFSAVALVCAVPILVLEASGAEVSGPLVQFGSTMLMLVASGAITSGVLRAQSGEAPRFGKMLGVGTTRCFRLFGVSFVTSLAIGLGLLLLVVPGLIALSAFYAAVPAATAEEGGVGAAISRSQALTKGQRWRVLPVALLFDLLPLLPVLAAWPLAAAGLYGRPAVLACDAAWAVLSALAATAPAVVYHDLRVRREGVDSAQLAAIFA